MTAGGTAPLWNFAVIATANKIHYACAGGKPASRLFGRLHSGFDLLGKILFSGGDRSQSQLVKNTTLPFALGSMSSLYTRGRESIFEQPGANGGVGSERVRLDHVLVYFGNLVHIFIFKIFRSCISAFSKRSPQFWGGIFYKKFLK